MQYATRFAVVSVCLLASCVPSVHQLYTDGDLVFNSALLGEWIPGEWIPEATKERWIFKQSDAKQYKLTYIDNKGLRGEFVVHMLKIGDKTFLDLVPEKPRLHTNAFYKMHLLPAHTFLHVSQIGPTRSEIEPTLKMSFLNLNWLKQFLERNPQAIRHEKVRHGILLTASTKELQGFLLEHIDTKKAFAKLRDMKRKPK